MFTNLRNFANICWRRRAGLFGSVANHERREGSLFALVFSAETCLCAARVVPASLPDRISDESSQNAGETLKRFLPIFSNRIFDSSVDGAMRNLAAVPVGPNTRPPLSFRAASIMSISSAWSLQESSIWFFGSVRDRCCGNQLSSIEKISVSQSITDRSMTFWSSRMFPGQ
jgi:hypothetical protein